MPDDPVSLDEIALETAWTVIMARRWVASPELLFALKAWVIELETRAEREKARVQG